LIKQARLYFRNKAVCHKNTIGPAKFQQLALDPSKLSKVDSTPAFRQTLKNWRC